MSNIQSCKNAHYTPRARFYRSARSLLLTLLVLGGLGLFVDRDIFSLARVIAFCWGISLFVKYVKMAGLPGTRGWLSDDYLDWVNHRETTTNTDNDPNDGEDYDPLWKEKDLV